MLRRCGHRRRAGTRQATVSRRARSYTRCGAHRDSGITRRTAAADHNCDARQPSPRKRNGARLFRGVMTTRDPVGRVPLPAWPGKEERATLLSRRAAANVSKIVRAEINEPQRWRSAPSVDSGVSEASAFLRASGRTRPTIAQTVLADSSCNSLFLHLLCSNAVWHGSCDGFTSITGCSRLGIAVADVHRGAL
jgi:hypothetical protein